MGRRRSSEAFVGRAAELGWLTELLDEAAAGRPAIVLLGGDSGVGKTRLAAEFVASVRRTGGHALVGSCPLIREGELPFAPVTEALRGFLREADDAALARIVGPAVTDLRPLVPEIARFAPRDGEDVTTQARMYDGLLGVLERAATPERPAVLVVEDLQWVDRATRDLLSFIAQSVARMRVLVVGTYRTDEVHPGGALAVLLADLERSGLAERRFIGGLAPEDVAELVASLSSEPPSASLVAAVHGRSDGNPYLVEELVAGRGADGSLPEAPPVGVREQVAGRIAALPLESQEVMRLMATVGRRSSHKLIALTSRFPELILLAALREATRQQVIVPITEPGAEGYAFRQGIFQEVLYDDLLPGERQANHRLVAEALAEHPELAWGSEAMAAAALARHWLAAGDTARALSAAIRAGSAAREAFAFAEAQRHFETALDLLERAGRPEPDRRIGFRPREDAPGSAERATLLEQAAEAAHLAGDPQAAVKHARALLSSGPHADADRARIESRLGRYLADAGDLEAAIEAHLAAAASADRAGSPSQRVRARGELARALERAGRFTEASEVATAALEDARVAGLDPDAVSVLTTLAVIQARTGQVADGLRSLERVRAIRKEHGLSQVLPRPSRVGTIVRSYAEIAEVFERAGAHEASEAAARQAAELARSLGAWGSWGRYLESNAASALYYLGRWDEALQATADVTGDDGARRRLDASWARATIVRARIDVARGNVDEAAARFEACERASKGDTMTLAELAVGLAELALWRRGGTDALAALEAGRERIGQADDPAPRAMLAAFALRASADLADHARARRSPADVESALRDAGPWLAEIRGLESQPSGDGAERPPLLRGYPEQAEAEWLRAAGEPAAAAWTATADRWAALGEPYAHAYALMREAEALLGGRGDRAAAGHAARSAHGIARALLAAPLMADIEALARRARIELEEPERPVAPETPEQALGLTAREYEVLLLIADGRTNRQIAEALFITEKTAGHHVSNLLGKLGLTSRVEAAALAHRLGLALTPPKPPAE